MNNFPSIKKNYAFNLLLSLVNLVYPFVTLAYVARVIGPGYLGKYYFASSVVTYFLFAAGFGIPMYGVREIGRHRNDARALGRVFSELLALGALASLTATALFLAVTVCVPEFRGDWRLFLVLGALLPVNILSVDFLFLGLENQANIAYRSLLSKIASLILLFTLVRKPSDFLWYAAITSIGPLLHNLMALPLAFRRIKPVFTGLIPRRHLRPLGFLLLNLLTVNVYVNLDSVVLGFLAGKLEVGYFNTAIRISRIAASLVATMGVTVIPRITYYLEAGLEADYRALLGKSMDLICFLALPSMLGLAICSDGILAALFGPAFRPAAAALAITSPLVFLTGYSNFIGNQVLFPRGEERLIFLASLAAACVSLAVNFALAPHLGRNGSALAALGADLTVVTLQLRWAYSRHGSVPLLGPNFAKYVTAGCVLAALLIAARFIHPLTPLFLATALAAAAAAYLLTLRLLGEPFTGEYAVKLARRFRTGPGGGG